MIIYFCDRQLNILATASTSLPEGYRISDDTTVEDVESGVNIFECEVNWTAGSQMDLENAAAVGNYVLKSGHNKDNYDMLFQIIDSESDTKAKSVSVYAEDAGLDLLNMKCEGVKLVDKTLQYMMEYFLPSGWILNIHDASTTTKTNEWTGESTCTERIRSVAGLWDCELYYSFVIEGLAISERVVNVVQKRGQQNAIPQLRLNYDIDRIVTKNSIANLSTALKVTGGTPEGSSTPINLIDYDYEYIDPETLDDYVVDLQTGQMRNLTAMDKWSSEVDLDGLMISSFSYNTLDKAVLAGQARAELQKRSKPSVNYEVEMEKLPEGAAIGDRVNIIDDGGGLYLEARLLKIETSESSGKQKATLGEYLIKSNGISEKVQEIANEMPLVASMRLTISYEVTDNIAYFRAEVYRGNVIVTDEFAAASFTWYRKTEDYGTTTDGKVNLGTGKTKDVPLSDIKYIGSIRCELIT